MTVETAALAMAVTAESISPHAKGMDGRCMGGAVAESRHQCLLVAAAARKAQDVESARERETPSSPSLPLPLAAHMKLVILLLHPVM